MATSELPFAQRARNLAGLGLAWHAVEASVALVAGALAGSVALLGFGADSLIEMLAGGMLLWRLTGSRIASHAAEHTARRLIGGSFVVVAAYVAATAIYDLVAANEPSVSWVGIGLACVTLVTMPPLARAKTRNAERLASPAAKGESRQTMLCAYLSAALLAGLGLNAAFGWWWADPLAGLLIAGVALHEARAAWRGDGTCCAAV